MNDMQIVEQLTDVVKKQSDIILWLYSELAQHVAAEELEKYAELMDTAKGIAEKVNIYSFGSLESREALLFQ